MTDPTTLFENEVAQGNPLDLIEEYFQVLGATSERDEDEEGTGNFVVGVNFGVHEFTLDFTWHKNLRVIEFTCEYPVYSSPEGERDMHYACGLFNGRIFQGALKLLPVDEGSKRVVFSQAFPLPDGLLDPGRLGNLLTETEIMAEELLPLLKGVSDGKLTPVEALNILDMDTEGSA